MISVRSPKFKEMFDSLPGDVQEAAKQAYTLWREDMRHPSLHFKKVNAKYDFWSVRIDLNYRAICAKSNSEDGESKYLWWWIGPHDVYERNIG